VTANLLPILLAAALGAGSPAAAGTPSPDEALRQRIDAYLGSIDTPIPASRWRALGPGAVPILAAVARDAAELPTWRARALAALSLIGGDEAIEAAKGVALAEGPLLVRVEAVDSLARLVPKAELGAALGPVMARADHPGVRAAAAQALALRGTPADCPAVEAQAAAEPAPERPRYRRALEACGTVR